MQTIVLKSHFDRSRTITIKISISYAKFIKKINSLSNTVLSKRFNQHNFYLFAFDMNKKRLWRISNDIGCLSKMILSFVKNSVQCRIFSRHGYIFFRFASLTILLIVIWNLTRIRNWFANFYLSLKIMNFGCCFCFS